MYEGELRIVVCGDIAFVENCHFRRSLVRVFGKLHVRCALGVKTPSYYLIEMTISSFRVILSMSYHLK